MWHVYSRKRWYQRPADPRCQTAKHESRWIKSLGAASQLNHLFIGEEEELAFFTEDIREYYHSFQIPRQRELRNALKLKIPVSAVRHLRAYEPALEEEDTVMPLLGTMAMGNCNAVGVGGLHICLKNRPSRKGFLAGLMIDDLVLIEARQKSE